MFKVHEFSVFIENKPAFLVRVRYSRPGFPEIALIDKVSTEAEDEFIYRHLREGNLKVAQFGRPYSRVPVNDVLATVTVHKDTSRKAVLVPGDLQCIRVADFIRAKGGIC